MNKFAIEKLLRDNESRHSDFQIENFIIGGQCDVWAQYKQCLREIKTRYESINNHAAKVKALSFEVKKTNSFKVLSILNWLCFWNRKKLKIIANPLAGDGRENIENLTAELECFLKIAEKLKKQIGEVSPERRYQLESESWKRKGLKMAAVDILSTGRVSNQTYDFIFSLPKKAQLEIFHKLKDNPPMNLLGFESDEIRTLSNQGRGT